MSAPGDSGAGTEGSGDAFAGRRVLYKKTVDEAESRRKREEHAVAIGKKKREEQLSKRRMALAEAAVKAESMTPAAAARPLPVPTAEDIPRLCEALRATTNEEELTTIVSQFRRMLSKEDSPPIDEVIRAGLTPVLMNFLQVAQYDRLVFESAWALTNIASGTSDNTRTVVAAGAIPVFVRLLNHSDVNVCEQATWALGNIAGDSAALRDAVLHAGALPGVLRHLAYGTKLSFIRNGTWTLSNFLRSKPTPEQQYINDILPMLGRLLYSDDVDVLTDALWALSYLTDGDDPALLQCALEAGVCSRLAVLLRHPSANIVTPALRVVGNIVTGDEIQTQVMINVGALESLLAVLSGSRKNLRKEACWAISNIMAGNTAQIQAVLDTGIVAKLVDLLSNGSLEVRREACWALSNASTAGTTDQLIFLIQQSCIAPLTEVIKSQEVDMCIVAMEGIDNLLVAMAGCSDSSLLTHTKELCEEADLPNILYDRIDHPNRDVSSKALRMHDAWFPDYDRDYDDDVGDDEYSAGGGGGGEYGVPHGTPAAAAAPAVNAGGEYAFSADPSSSWQHTMSDASYKFDFSRDT